MALAFWLGTEVGGELARLDHIVVARFEGQRFRIPSRVLSAPTLLSPGLDANRIELRATLTRLGYQEEARSALPLAPGRFRTGPGELRIHLRAFEHPSRPEPARDVVLQLDGSEITEIRDVATGREMFGVVLEPELVGSYYGPDREQRELVRLDEVPRHVVDAVLSAEDQRFDEHVGVDPVRIVGALVANLRAGGVTQGGSTVTEQLVKNFFLTPDRTFARRLRTAAMSLLVEARYGKDEILECYLNEIYLAQRGSTEVHGVGEASRLYFGKSVREVSVAEAALMAAVIPGPNAISPYRNPERARARRDIVLGQMREQGKIDDATHAAAVAEPLRLSSVTPEPSEARYFLDFVRRQLPDVYASEALSSEGLRIYATLDLRLQRAATTALREGLADLEKRHPKLRTADSAQQLQGCVIVLRPQTGEVLALVGGRDYATSQFDRCTQATRQMGSVFKPVVYLAGLEPDVDPPQITLASHLLDEPVSIPAPGGAWTPANYDHRFRGRVGVREALERSLNVPTVRLAQQIGVPHLVDLARRLGIASRLPRVPSLALGVADVAPLEVARAYATIAAGGMRPRIISFEDAFDPAGRPIARPLVVRERVVDPGAAFLAISLLEGVIDRGTATAVRGAGIEGPVAGKTGTTDDGRDAWFAGFTPELLTIVWVGFDRPRPTGLTGASGALPVWIRFMKEATGGRIEGAFAVPEQIVRLEIERDSGAVAYDGCAARDPEWFLPGTEPTATCPPGASSADAVAKSPERTPHSGAKTDGEPSQKRRGLLGWVRDLF